MIAGHTYHASQAREWDQAVGTSRNGTFLLRRSFMDYHANRFTDHSLLFKNQTGHILGLLPAHIRPEQHLAISHGGLTYGGLVLSPKATLTDVREMLVDTALRFWPKVADNSSISPFPTSITPTPHKKTYIGSSEPRHNSRQGLWPAP